MNCVSSRRPIFISRAQRRAVFIRQLLGGIALVMVAAFSIGYWGA
jgi:hypothetical protein